MKKLVILLICTSLMWTFSCTKVVKEDPKAVIMADNIPLILYAGLENPVTVIISGVTDDQINLSINNGIVTGSDESGKFLVNLPEDTETGQGELYVTWGDETDTISCIIRAIPEPTAYLQGYNSGEISKAILPELTKITCQSDGFLWEANKEWEVVQYAIILQPLEGPAKFFKVDGAEISEIVKESLIIQETGATIIVSDIFVMNPFNGEKTKTSSSIVLKVIE